MMEVKGIIEDLIDLSVELEKAGYNPTFFLHGVPYDQIPVDKLPIRNYYNSNSYSSADSLVSVWPDDDKRTRPPVWHWRHWVPQKKNV